jgi:hypothetical protein
MLVAYRFEIPQPPGDILDLPPAEVAALIADGKVKEIVLLRATDTNCRVLGSLYQKGEIFGCSPAVAEVLLAYSPVERVGLAERNAIIERSREEEAARQSEELIHLRALISTNVPGYSYYSAVRREVASFPKAKAEELLAWRTTAGEPFFEEVSSSEMEALWQGQREDREAAEAAGPRKLTLVRFLISLSCFGTFYSSTGGPDGRGEVAGFAGEQLEYLLAARTQRDEPFVEVVGEIYDDGTPVPAEGA